MVMETIQIRLTTKLVEKLGELVKQGYYPNKSEAVRDAVRRLILEQELGELGEELESAEVKKQVAEKVSKLREYCH
tara:strand:- start:688 stop:915 length:228 start_codon:yes stop_codon:yes gene_type:complete